MPSKSKSQHDFFVIAAHNPVFAKANKISQKVAREFLEEDKKHGLWQGENKKSDKKESDK